LNIDHGQLIHSEAVTDDDLSDSEIDEYAATFRAALALAHEDPAEAARIDALVAELDADVHLFDMGDVTHQEVDPRRSHGRSHPPQSSDPRVSVRPACNRRGRGSYPSKGRGQQLKKKTKNPVQFYGAMVSATTS
jgi:hypothetical protein